MEYVDGFVIAIPEKNVKNYIKLARAAAKVWMKYGALEYRECVGDDLGGDAGHDAGAPKILSFKKLAKTKPGETVVFSWITYKSRAHRDRVNKQVMADPAIAEMMKNHEMPFDTKRMAYGGFKTIVKG